MGEGKSQTTVAWTMSGDEEAMPANVVVYQEVL
jgi:hypothetical protein